MKLTVKKSQLATRFTEDADDLRARSMDVRNQCLEDEQVFNRLLSVSNYESILSAFAPSSVGIKFALALVQPPVVIWTACRFRVTLLAQLSFIIFD